MMLDSRLMASQIGQAIIIPVAFHSAVALACSVLIFPETVNAQFGKRLRAVFIPLAKAIEQQPALLSQSPVSPDFNPQPFINLIATSEAALASLAASARLIKRDVSWGRFGANDLSQLHAFARRLTVGYLSTYTSKKGADYGGFTGPREWHGVLLQNHRPNARQVPCDSCAVASRHTIGHADPLAAAFPDARRGARS